jgi:hypothetical protein
VFERDGLAGGSTDPQRRHPFWEQGGYLWGTPEPLDEVFDEIRQLGYAVLVFRTEHV